MNKKFSVKKMSSRTQRPGTVTYTTVSPTRTVLTQPSAPTFTTVSPTSTVSVATPITAIGTPVESPTRTVTYTTVSQPVSTPFIQQGNGLLLESPTNHGLAFPPYSTVVTQTAVPSPLPQVRRQGQPIARLSSNDVYNLVFKAIFEREEDNLPTHVSDIIDTVVSSCGSVCNCDDIFKILKAIDAVIENNGARFVGSELHLIYNNSYQY